MKVVNIFQSTLLAVKLLAMYNPNFKSTSSQNLFDSFSINLFQSG